MPMENIIQPSLLFSAFSLLIPWIFPWSKLHCIASILWITRNKWEGHRRNEIETSSTPSISFRESKLFARSFVCSFARWPVHADGYWIFKTFFVEGNSVSSLAVCAVKADFGWISSMIYGLPRWWFTETIFRGTTHDFSKHTQICSNIIHAILSLRKLYYHYHHYQQQDITVFQWK